MANQTVAHRIGMVPEQYLPNNQGRRHDYCLGERSLWVATLMDAMELASGRGVRGDDNIPLKVLQRSARRWVMSDSFEMTSFLWTCEMIGFEPEAFRKVINAD